MFREGRHLLADGHVAEACDKFAQSQRLEPSPGALLNLARCHADAGKTGTAWAEYSAAARLARSQDRPQQAAEAELRAAELQPRLLRLEIEVDAQKTPGVVVLHDGEPLASADLNIPMIVDPGNHVIRATAPGHTDWTMTVLVTEPGPVRMISIPALTPLAPSPRVASAPSTRELPRSTRAAPPTPERHAVSAPTWVAGGVAAAALVGSGVLAGIAKSKWDSAHDDGDCDPTHACNRNGLLETDRARHLGNLATAFAGIGIAAGACAVLFYSSDVKSRGSAVKTQLAVGPASVVLGMRGGF